MARPIRDGEQQIADLLRHLLVFASRDSGVGFGQFLIDLAAHAARRRPVKADPTRTAAELGSARQRRQRARYIRQYALHSGLRALARLLRLPRYVQLRYLQRLGLEEDVRMAPDQLVADAARHRGEIETTGLLRHACVEYDLEQQIAQLITQARQIAASDGVGDFVGLLDGKRRDADKILLPIPCAPGVRVAQRTHERQQCLEFLAGGAHAAAPANTSRRFARMPAVAPQMLYGPKDSSQVSTSTSRMVRRPTR